MKRKYSGELRLDEKGLRKVCGNGNGKPVFICSANDLFAEAVPSEIIRAVLERCGEYDDEYLFHTKNPVRLNAFCGLLPEKSILATTIETDLDTSLISRAPEAYVRLGALGELRLAFRDGRMNARPVMVTVEPVLKFGYGFAEQLSYIEPDVVNFGADTGNNGLVEPTPERLRSLIGEVRQFCSDVRLKPNLKRLLPIEVPNELGNEESD